jgi:hypothetical protein
VSLFNSNYDKWEAGMNDVKKNSGSFVPNDDFDPDFAHASHSKPADDDSDPEFSYTSDPEIERYERMSPEEVQRQLERLGIDPQPTIDAVTKLVREKLEEWEKWGLLHPEETPLTISPASGARSFRIIVETNSAAPPHPPQTWHQTHAIALQLGQAPTLGEKRAVIAEGFEHLGVAADALRTRCAVDLDAAWPLTECAEEAAIEAAANPGTWDAYARGYASLVERSSPALQCMLVHGVKQLLERGADAQRLAADVCAAVLETDPSDDARMLVLRLAHRFPAVRVRIADAPEHTIGSELRDRFAAIEETRHEALQTFARLRATRDESQYFESAPVTKLLGLLHGDPLSTFLSMYALGDVYLCAAMFVTQDPKERQKAEHSIFAEKMLDRLRDESASHFLTVETFEPIRERYPSFAAALMARLAPHVSSPAQQALLICLAEGYEQAFGGKRQAIVPRFELDGAPRFVPAAANELDLFGERFCGAANAGELREPLQWLNDRLSLWLTAA